MKVISVRNTSGRFFLKNFMYRNNQLHSPMADPGDTYPYRRFCEGDFLEETKYTSLVPCVSGIHFYEFPSAAPYEFCWPRSTIHVYHVSPIGETLRYRNKYLCRTLKINGFMFSFKSGESDALVMEKARKAAIGARYRMKNGRYTNT